MDVSIVWSKLEVSDSLPTLPVAGLQFMERYGTKARTYEDVPVRYTNWSLPGRNRPEPQAVPVLLENSYLVLFIFFIIKVSVHKIGF